MVCYCAIVAGVHQFQMNAVEQVQNSRKLLGMFDMGNTMGNMALDFSDGLAFR